MAHITLSIPDEVYTEMKRHPEIKWSEVARHSIIQKTHLLKTSMSGKDVMGLLSVKTRISLEKVPEKDWAKFSKEGKKRSWKRRSYLTQA